MMTIDFYSILPLTSALFMILFGLFVLFKDTKSRMNQLLFGFCISMLFWLFGTFMMFATRGNLASSVFWDRFVYAGVVFIPPLMHQFSLLFTKQADKQKKLLFINYTLAFFFLIASRTQYFVDGLYYYSWGVHTQAKILHDAFLVYFFLGTGLFFRNLWSYYKKATDHISKLQTIYVFLAFASIIFIGGSAYLFAYGIDTKFPFAYISGLVFPIMLFYAVSKHHLLGTKVIAIEVLVGLTEFLVVMQIFFAKNTEDIIIRFIFAALIAFISFLLIRSTRKETQAREKQIRFSAMEDSLDKLKELDRQKTEFLNIAAHHLRTPVSIIRNYVAMVQEGDFGAVPENLREVLDHIFQSNQWLVRLADEIINIAHLESGQTKFHLAPGDLRAVVNNTVTELKPKAEQKNLRLIMEEIPECLPAYFDEDKIKFALLNYIENAIKYTPAGAITVSAQTVNNGVSITVRDTGIGFVEADRQEFFQKFKRGENAQELEVNTSTGLGLYIVSKFVEGHGGRVWAKSEGAEKGSEFGFWIPSQSVN